MEKYSYELEGQIIQVATVEEVPQGLEYQIIPFELPDENLISIEVKMLTLQSYSSDLRVRAKAAAIGKKGERDYIFAQVEMYELKYKIANDEIVGEYFTDLLANEAIEFGTTIGVNLDLATFKELIINRYETAEAQYRQFLFMIERCRTFIQTLIETNQFDKVDSAFAMIDTLNDVSQATTLMANILEL